MLMLMLMHHHGPGAQQTRPSRIVSDTAGRQPQLQGQDQRRIPRQISRDRLYRKMSKKGRGRRQSTSRKSDDRVVPAFSRREQQRWGLVLRFSSCRLSVSRIVLRDDDDCAPLQQAGRNYRGKKKNSMMVIKFGDNGAHTGTACFFASQPAPVRAKSTTDKTQAPRLNPGGQ
jgi:hypothetical protein